MKGLHSVASSQRGDPLTHFDDGTSAIAPNDSRVLLHKHAEGLDHPIERVESSSFDLYQHLPRARLGDLGRPDGELSEFGFEEERFLLSRHGKDVG